MRKYGSLILQLLIYFSIHDFIGTCGYEVLIGNDVCDDEANTPACNYDGADCCGDCVNTQSCSECQCHNEDIWQDLVYHGFNFNGTRICYDSTGTISSPGYYGNNYHYYPNNVAMTWLIQQPLGKFIEIKFNAFEIWW